jgi:YHS domain-containing protein
VIRILLLTIAVLLLARAFWRVVDGILEAAGASDRGASAVKLVRDPVCGTFVAPRAALTLTSHGETHYFCSEECRAKYRAA